MKNLNIAFYLKKDKITTNQKAPIYVRLGLFGDITSFSTGFSIQPDRWKSTKQLKLVRKSEDMLIRGEMDKLRTKILSTFTDFQMKNQITSVKNLKEAITNYEENKKLRDQTLTTLFTLHNETFDKKVGVEMRAKATSTKYKTVQSHLISYLTETYKISDIQVCALNYKFIEGFDLYLRLNKRLSNNTTVKYCQCLRSMVFTSMKHEWIKSDPFIKYEGKLAEIKTYFLTQEQLDLIANTDFKIERLNLVRDVFVFGCYTGYAPCDLEKLTNQNIQKSNDGDLWILTSRKKTKIQSDVPLLPPALEIIEKYRNHPKCLLKNKIIPYTTNQNMNAYLKEIQDICLIPFNLHFYISRHTFATTIIIGNGGSMESLSVMIGHKRITQTQHYGKIQNDLVGSEMKKIADIYRNKKLI